MKLKTLTATALTTTLLAGGMTAVTAHPAEAAGHTYTATAGGHARATFKSAGNWFYVFDTVADGHSGLGQVYVNKKYVTVSASGNGNSTGHQFNSIRNGAHFKFRACYGNHGSHGWQIKRCGTWVNAVA